MCVCSSTVPYLTTLDVCDSHTQLWYGVPLWPLRPYSLVLKPYSITLLLCPDTLTTAMSPRPDALAMVMSPASPSFCHRGNTVSLRDWHFHSEKELQNHQAFSHFKKRFQSLQVSYTYVLCIGHATSLHLPVPSNIMPGSMCALVHLILLWTWNEGSLGGLVSSYGGSGFISQRLHCGSQPSVSSKGFDIIFWSLKVLQAHDTHTYM